MITYPELVCVLLKRFFIPLKMYDFLHFSLKESPKV